MKFFSPSLCELYFTTTFVGIDNLLSNCQDIFHLLCIANGGIANHKVHKAALFFICLVSFRLLQILARYFPFQVCTKVSFISTPNCFEKWWIAAWLPCSEAYSLMDPFCSGMKLAYFPSSFCSWWRNSHIFIGIFNRCRANVRTGVHWGLERRTCPKAASTGTTPSFYWRITWEIARI